MSTVKIKIQTPQELLHALPQSGIFEMFDCRVEINCPGLADEADVNKMVSMIKSAINVTDMHIEYLVDLDFFFIQIDEVPLQVAEGRIL